MKEELQGKLVEILTSIQTAAGKASDFAMAELPDIAQSYIAYGRAVYTAGFVIGLILLVAIAYVGWRVHKHESRRSYYDAFNVFFPTGMAGAVVSGIMAISFGPLMLVWFAPKVWLLKEIAGMLK
jgi:hypothetical protein